MSRRGVGRPFLIFAISATRLEGTPAQTVPVGQDKEAAPLGMVLIPRKDSDPS